MSRRTARTGALLLAGFLLALFGIAGVATAQENERLKVDFRETIPGKEGKLGITVGMSGEAWDPSLQLTQDAFSSTHQREPGRHHRSGSVGGTAGQQRAVGGDPGSRHQRQHA